MLATQIEVLRGPSALVYGNGAVGGVVNVLDGKVPTAIPQKKGTKAAPSCAPTPPVRGGCFIADRRCGQPGGACGGRGARRGRLPRGQGLGA